jgi:hypothetical protein
MVRLQVRIEYVQILVSSYLTLAYGQYSESQVRFKRVSPFCSRLRPTTASVSRGLPRRVQRREFVYRVGTVLPIDPHDDPKARHRSLPPGLCDTDVGLQAQPPLRTAKWATILGPIRAPLGRRPHRTFDEQMRQLCAHRQWQDRTEPGGQARVPGRPSLPGNRRDLGGVPWVRRRSRRPAQARRQGCAGEYAVADAPRGAR